eukprot:7854593-Alexandrium_andersonii.AAC.1
MLRVDLHAYADRRVGTTEVLKIGTKLARFFAGQANSAALAASCQRAVLVRPLVQCSPMLASLGTLRAGGTLL